MEHSYQNNNDDDHDETLQNGSNKQHGAKQNGRDKHYKTEPQLLWTKNKEISHRNNQDSTAQTNQSELELQTPNAPHISIPLADENSPLERSGEEKLLPT